MWHGSSRRSFYNNRRRDSTERRCGGDASEAAAHSWWKNVQWHRTDSSFKAFHVRPITIKCRPALMPLSASTRDDILLQWVCEPIARLARHRTARMRVTASRSDRCWKTFLEKKTFPYRPTLSFWDHATGNTTYFRFGPSNAMGLILMKNKSKQQRLLLISWILCYLTSCMIRR